MIRAANLAQRLANILAARGKSADFLLDCRCVDDRDGLPPRLAYWDAIKLGAEPTQAEVDAAPEAPSAALRDLQAAAAVDGVDRLQFEHLFDLENRMRAQESLAAITRAQYRTALINRWKAINP